MARFTIVLSESPSWPLSPPSALAASFAQREVLSWERSQTPQIAGGPDSGRAFEVLRLGVPAPHLERARAPVKILNLDQVAKESKAIPRLWDGPHQRLKVLAKRRPPIPRVGDPRKPLLNSQLPASRGHWDLDVASREDEFLHPAGHSPLHGRSTAYYPYAFA